MASPRSYTPTPKRPEISPPERIEFLNSSFTSYFGNSSDVNLKNVVMGQSGRLYLVEELIGRGGFGTVHTAKICGFRSNAEQNLVLKDNEDLKKDFALPKNEDLVEDLDKIKLAIKTEQKGPLLLEIDVLTSTKNCTHFCKLIDIGIEPTTDTNFMVMTLCGPSLSDMRNALSNRRFSFSTVIRIAMQTLHSIQELHELGYLQRDVKPSNYAIGRRENRQHRLVFMLDFGISRYFLDYRGRPLTPRPSPGWRGTSRYCSLNNHLNLDLSRRDDIESWFYAIVELLSGELPWQYLGRKHKDKVADMKRLARSLGRPHLLFRCPKEFDILLDVIDQWSFFSVPDYDGIYVFLMRIMRESDVDFDEPYDWEKMVVLLNPLRKLEAKPISVSTLYKRRNAFIEFYGESPGADLSRLRSAFDPPHNWLAGRERWDDRVAIKKKAIFPKVLKKMNPMAAVNRKGRSYWPQKEQQQQFKKSDKENII